VVNEQTAGFGAELRRRRDTAGLSLSALAARGHYSKGHLSRVENGHSRPDRAVAEACDRALGTSGGPAALLPDARPGATIGLSGLPAVTRHFVGRVSELACIRAALLDQDSGAAACVLHGMAGVGKTALALRAARDVEAEFPDGCLFFDLNGD